MSTARQVIRWAIPGWSFLIFIALFLLARGTILTGTRLLDISTWYRDPAVRFVIEHVAPESAAVLGALGVPLGFLLYQVYFWGYWRGRGFGRTEPQDKGWEIIRDLDVDWRDRLGLQQDELPQQCLILKEFKLLRPSNIARQLLRNWHVSQSLLAITLDENEAEGTRRSIEYLTDVYHSVGTARMSLFSAFFFVYLPMVAKDIWSTFRTLGLVFDPSSPYLRSSLLNASIATLAYFILSATRRNVLQDLVAIQRTYLASVYGIRVRTYRG